MPNENINVNEEQEVLVESNINLPNHRRIVRCIEADYKFSKTSNKPMIQFTFEIVKPAIERVGMNMYQIAGLQTTQWLMLDLKNIPAAKKFLAKLNLDEPFDFNQPNTEAMVGICLEVTGGSKKKVKDEYSYNENGEVVTQALIDPETNKPVIEYSYSFNLVSNMYGNSDVLRRVSNNESEMPF